MKTRPIDILAKLKRRHLSVVRRIAHTAVLKHENIVVQPYAEIEVGEGHVFSVGDLHWRLDNGRWKRLDKS